MRLVRQIFKAFHFIWRGCDSNGLSRSTFLFIQNLQGNLRAGCVPEIKSKAYPDLNSGHSGLVWLVFRRFVNGKESLT